MTTDPPLRDMGCAVQQGACKEKSGLQRTADAEALQAFIRNNHVTAGD